MNNEIIPCVVFLTSQPKGPTGINTAKVGGGTPTLRKVFLISLAKIS